MTSVIVAATFAFTLTNGVAQKPMQIEIEKRACGFASRGALIHPVYGRLEGSFKITCKGSK